jgi:MerR family transcriptional regulator/heat shock protein HspR
LRDIANLREVQRLSHDEGINLAGIKRILALEGEVEQLMRQVEYLRAFAEPGRRIFTADPTGDVVAVRRTERRSLRPVRGELPSHRGSLILWRPASR